MKILKRVLFGLLLVAVVALLVFSIWLATPLSPAPEAFAGLRSNAQVTVSIDKFIVFQPASKKPTAGFVFYPGARVDHRSYAAPLHQIAEEGYVVILLPVPFNLAVLDSNAADRAIAAFPSIRHWTVGGHSLGGAAAAIYASNHDVDGLVLWASYPGNDALRDSAAKVLSVYGTKDMSGMNAFEQARALLPRDAQYVVIEGGNHAQFGDYGFQPGDNEATISRSDQQKQVVDATLQFLKEVSQ